MRSDDAIKTDILDELTFDPEIDMSEIGVAVHNGAVTLTGTVETLPERLAAERAVGRVKGVLAVAQDIRVALSGEAATDDSELARRIARILEWDPAIPHTGIKAHVRDGDVVLTGEVEWHFQRETVEHHVARIGGVRSLVNELQVMRQASEREIRRTIVRALHRDADLEAAQIKVELEGGTVRLCGRVRTAHERDIITNAVSAAPGVETIEDELRVEPG